jgi:hypothetical protein
LRSRRIDDGDKSLAVGEIVDFGGRLKVAAPEGFSGGWVVMMYGVLSSLHNAAPDMCGRSSGTLGRQRLAVVFG